MAPPPATWHDAYPAVRRVLLPRRRIARRVRALSRQIARHYRGREITLVPVLTGSVIFLADLIRRLPLPVRLSPVGVRSYPGRSVESRGAALVQPPGDDLAGRHVLVVDDILDGGATLGLLLDTVGAMAPASLAACVLLKKRRDDRPVGVEPDFVGFDIPNVFVVGYGLDFDGRYRNLPDVCVLNQHARPTRERAKEARP